MLCVSGAHREVGPEGSVEQNRGLMDKNRIRGLPGRTSELLIAKSTTIKDRGGKSGGRAVKAVDLTSGGLRCCLGNETESVARRSIAAQKSAKGIVGGAIR
jgi:hypothetical protein